MGEEEKKPAEEGKKPENDQKVEKKEEEKAADHQKPSEEKNDEKKAEESKESPPPPPPEIVLKVYMHCEGCARKVRRCLQGFAGVEDVMTDCKSGKVVVKGEKADPLKVLERVQKKSHRQVELLSPIPKPPAEEEKKTEEEKEKDKPDEKKEEPQPQVITVVLKVYMHCEACAQEIKKRILRMKGVESAEPDLKSSQVTVKGVFDAPKLVEYVFKRTGKHAAIVKQEPEKKEEEEKGKEEKKPEEGGSDEGKKESGQGKGQEGGGGGDGKGPELAAFAEGGTEESKVVEVKKNEYYYHYYPQRNVMEMYNYHSQIFSDENPNACYIM